MRKLYLVIINNKEIFRTRNRELAYKVLDRYISHGAKEFKRSDIIDPNNYVVEIFNDYEDEIENEM